jgi:glycosyltransferase involved in cell wall biosynthesis
MILLEYANHDRSTIRDSFGAPEYSYWFVKKAFAHVLDQLGERVEIADPAQEVDQIFRAASERGEPCIFLPFCPPNTTPLGLACPTVPLFAWEFDRIPDESWNDDPHEDWTYVLARTAGAITHCRSAADAVRRGMGDDYPVWVIPAPVFDAHARASGPARGWREPFDLVVEGGLALSAGDVDLSLFRPERGRAEAVHALRVLDRAASAPGRPPQRLRLDGVIYTAVLNPYDGRKNWRDLITGFVWAFRETPTATLLLKLTRYDLDDGLLPVLQHLSTLGPFGCRVVLIQGLLSDEAYRAVIEATSFAVNTAYGEGQCLPLMEYMAAGRPVVTPAHTAMLDYATPKNAFVIASDACLTSWPHDERQAKRCLHYRISFADYVRRLRESYRLAREDAAGYARMSAEAVEAMRAFCSDEVVTTRLRDVLRRVARARRRLRKAV